MTWNTLNHAKLNFFKLFDVFLIHSIYILLYSCKKYWQISISKWIITSKSWQIWIKSARVIFSANKKKLHFCWWFWSRKSSQVEHLAYQKNLCLTTHLNGQPPLCLLLYGQYIDFFWEDYFFGLFITVCIEQNIRFYCPTLLFFQFLT